MNMLKTIYQRCVMRMRVNAMYVSVRLGDVAVEGGVASIGASVRSSGNLCVEYVCLLLQDLLQSCSRGGEEESGRHVL